MCVIVNDICAYLFGFFFGKTPLIKLSPKKTWEGFIGGIFGTLVWAVISVNILASSNFMICPQAEISFELFKNPECAINPIFLNQEY